MRNQACSNIKIAGASFTISPMSDQFVDIILGALKEVDTSKVSMQTDDVTTTVRGKLNHVFDVTKAIFIHAATTGEHVTYQATYSIGCPDHTSNDHFIKTDNELMNEVNTKLINQYVAAKFSLYPLGDGEYMDVIYDQIETMKKHVKVSSAYSATRLDGEAIDIFNGLESIFSATVENGSSHTVMTVSISANSPSHK